MRVYFAIFPPASFYFPISQVCLYIKTHGEVMIRQTGDRSNGCNYFYFCFYFFINQYVELKMFRLMKFFCFVLFFFTTHQS